jgi:hypothetical protein
MVSCETSAKSICMICQWQKCETLSKFMIWILKKKTHETTICAAVSGVSNVK